jgi:heme o synthase
MVIRKYLQITKPGIVISNLVSVTGGFLLASQGNFNPILFLATIAGTSLVIASGCIFNNYIDRDIDAKMNRTRKRVLVQGLISTKAALICASIFFISGIIIFYLLVNWLSAILAISGFIVYVGIYSLYMKRHSVFGTFAGSFSGAMPPVIGYCAITNHFDLGALLLMIIFIIWQMPHSYAIGILCLDDYSKANIPVLPVKSGVKITKKHIIFYIAFLIIAESMLTIAGYTGYAYLIIVNITGIYWLYVALSGYKTADDKLWARKIFILSIVNITVLSLMMSSLLFDSYLLLAPM